MPNDAPLARPDAERELLGILLIAPNHYANVAAIITPDDFFRRSHADVFRAIGAVIGSGAVPDVATVGDRLPDATYGSLGDTYKALTEISSDIGPTANAEYHAHQVADLAGRRRAREAAYAQISQYENLDIPFDGAPTTTGTALPTPIEWGDFWAVDRTAEDWLIEPLVPRGRAVAIYAPGKAGKSLLTVDIAARAATGQRTLDQRPGQPLHVVYLDLEMTEGDLYERLSEMGYGPDVDLSHLHYYLLPDLPPLDTAEGGAAIRAIAQRDTADLVIIDTTSRVLEGPENDSDTVRAYWRHTGVLLKGDGRSVVRLDHSGKDTKRGQRGTSAKNDDVDLVWELTARAGEAVQLRATHRRMSWAPEVINLTRLAPPLRHERTATSWDRDAIQVAGWLDELGASLDATKRDALAALREAGHKVRDTTVLEALRYRRSEPGTTSGTTYPQLPGTTPGTNHRNGAAKPGTNTGTSGNHPPQQMGTTRFPPRGTGGPAQCWCPCHRGAGDHGEDSCPGCQNVEGVTAL